MIALDYFILVVHKQVKIFLKELILNSNYAQEIKKLNWVKLVFVVSHKGFISCPVQHPFVWV